MFVCPVSVCPSVTISKQRVRVFVHIQCPPVTDMISNVDIAVWILLVAGLAVTESAAAARDLSGTPMASQGATPVTRQDRMMEWLSITAVPLGVFLIGTCIWGCIKNSAVWRNLTSQRRGESIGDEMHSSVGSSSQARSDEEEGNVESEPSRCGRQLTITSRR